MVILNGTTTWDSNGNGTECYYWIVSQWYLNGNVTESYYWMVFECYLNGTKYYYWKFQLMVSEWYFNTNDSDYYYWKILLNGIRMVMRLNVIT